LAWKETHPFQRQPDGWALSEEQLIDLATQVMVSSQDPWNYFAGAF
jgi:hypothetical protein